MECLLLECHVCKIVQNLFQLQGLSMDRNAKVMQIEAAFRRVHMLHPRGYSKDGV